MKSLWKFLKNKFIPKTNNNNLVTETLDDVKEDSMNAERNFSYSSDEALTDPQKDMFGRFPFAKRIANTISERKDSSNLILAIYGEWGSGKTTVLNFIEGELNKSNHIITLKFNPWRFPDENELIMIFYNTLAEKFDQSLSTNKEKIGKVISDHVAIAASFFDKAELAERFGNKLSYVDLEELRDRIEEIIVNSGKHIVVIMDDIDRLDKSEIYSVFRLVKLSANLKNLVYILAFDHQIVADALQERYGNNNDDAGANFLEKIVQVPIKLPIIEPILLREFCFIEIDKVLTQNKIELTTNEAHLFMTYFYLGIEIKLNTPRIAIRYANTLIFSIPIIKDEVNIVDFLLIEAIRVFFPSLYESILVNKDAYLGKGLGTSQRDEKEKSEYKSIIENALKDFSSKEQISVTKLIEYLFPRYKSIFQNHIFGSESEKKWSIEKRICSEKYFDRYFLYSISSIDVSDLQINDLIKSLKSSNSIDILGKIDSILTIKNADNFIYKLNQLSTPLSEIESENLALVLSSIGNRFPNRQQLFQFNEPFSRAAMLVANLSKNIENVAKRIDLLKDIIKNSQPITFASEILSWIIPDKSNTSKILTDENVSELKIVLAVRISEEARLNPTIFLEEQEIDPGLLSIWSEYKSRDEVNKFIEALCETSQENIKKIITIYLSTSYPMDYSGSPHNSDFKIEQLQAMEKTFDTKPIYSKLIEIFGEKLYYKEFPKFHNDQDERLFSQFIWVYESKKK